MTRMHRQIVTLAVDFDIEKVPPPERWDWGMVADSLGPGAKIEVLAGGTVMPAPVEPDVPV